MMKNPESNSETTQPSIGKVDVLIVGSGPVGATYARILSRQRPAARILMIDLGPKISDKIGQHVKNITDPQALEKAQILSQGPHKEPYPMISVAERAEAAQRGELNPKFLARAGTHLVTESEQELQSNQMPAASLSSNIGGMGVHWTCACPRPGNEERIPFIPAEEMDKVLDKAEQFLKVSQEVFPMNIEGTTILETLNKALGTTHSPGRQAQPMPLACQRDQAGNLYWTASDVVLGDTLTNPNVILRSETIARQLIHENGSVSKVLIEHLPTHQQEEIEADIVIVAADALRTPQLLWASGIRLNALGHYLNEHPFIFTFVEMVPTAPAAEALASVGKKGGDPLVGVFWVPFDAPNHPFHGQIMHMDLSPMKTTVDNPGKHIVGLGWGCVKELSHNDQIVFSESEKDYVGMPKMTFKYEFSAKDRAAIAEAKAFQKKVAGIFGKEIKDGQQTLMPAGSSLHYEGTTRMGETNDGSSVCDTYSKVWGFDNLFVGGNGVIPMATTSNPTLTSVALAVRACERIMEKMSGL